MAATESTDQVVLAQEQSASVVLYQLLTDAVAAFPAAFDAKALANAEAFRRNYPQLLPAFESARLASAERLKIALHMATALKEHVLWRDPAGERTLHEALREPAEPQRLESHDFPGAAGWRANVVYRGERWDAERLPELADDLVRRGRMTAEAGEALKWICTGVLQDGELRLQGRKIAVLGGGAEMAPTRVWLEAGADVLWLDTRPPPESWWELEGMSGKLTWAKQGSDLLAEPREILATLIEFADGVPLDLGLYAYAPGRARELRLTATMNALVDALPVELIASVTMLVSPTTVSALSEPDVTAMQARVEERPFWEAACAALGLLGRGSGFLENADARVSRTVVGIQGASYQAAQYLGKILAAECWAEHGQLGALEPRPLRVSGNTAAITRTRSLAHPVFTAAFAGAAAMGVETLTPSQSRRLNGLLAVRDWLLPELPTPGPVRVHGGIHTLPYPLESALRVAAAIGFARSPRLLKGLFGK